MKDMEPTDLYNTRKKRFDCFMKGIFETGYLQ